MNVFSDYIADALTMHIASSEDCSDFIVRQGEDELVYVDIEAGKFFLITVREAQAVVCGAEAREDRSAVEGREEA